MILVFNDTKIIDFLLGTKGQGYYEGETKSSALTSLFQVISIQLYLEYI